MDLGLPGMSHSFANTSSLYMFQRVMSQILAILLLEVIVTLRGYGYSLDTWRTPFNELVTNGTGRHSGGISGHAETGLGGPTTGMTGVSSGPQVVQRV
jgi:hypothetical protein